jgi:ferredoxin
MGSKQGYGWLSGPALKPLALRCVFDVVQSVDLPVIGVGGISKGIDAIEFFMVGAQAVGVCTAAILRGPSIYGKIVREIDAWLDEHGYNSIEEIRGLAIRRWEEREFRTHHVPPQLDVETCTGCGLCETSCVYDAIHVVDGKAVLTPQNCYGCGLCVTRCPVQALAIS